MSEQEGVIKFKLEYTQTDLVEPPPDFDQLNAWRTICLQTGLIGQDPARYAGYGFGNLSMRVRAKGGEVENGDASLNFLISGTQTGHILKLPYHQYALVTACYPQENRVVAEGTWKPSSESMTHGVVYLLDPDATCVIHVHSPEIWKQADTLAIPQTGAEIPYGTPEMTEAVSRLYQETDLPDRKVFSMKGHEDGVVVFDETIAAAGHRLIDLYVAALSL